MSASHAQLPCHAKDHHKNGTRCLSEVLYPSHGFLSSAIWPPIPMVGCVLRPIDSEVIYRRHPHLLSFAKDVKLRLTPSPSGFEPQAVVWQSITLPLRHASFTPMPNKHSNGLGLFVCLFGFNVALKHLRSYHNGACL